MEICYFMKHKVAVSPVLSRFFIYLSTPQSGAGGSQWRDMAASPCHSC
jgi:hypothetical protein